MMYPQPGAWLRRDHRYFHFPHDMPRTKDDWLRLLRATTAAEVEANPTSGCNNELISHVHCEEPAPHIVVVSTCCDGKTEEECAEEHERKVAAACD